MTSVGDMEVPKPKRLSILIALILVAAAAIYGVRYFMTQRNPESLLTIQELDTKNQAAHLDRFTGEVFTRPSVPGDLESIKMLPIAQGRPADLVPIKENSTIALGSLFRVGPRSSLVFTSAGNWITSLENDGEYIFEDAKTNSEHSVHAVYWFIKQGTFRAKPYDYDPNKHLLQIRTPVARIFMENGEIGMTLSEGGRGQIWLVSGRAVVVWNDGRRKELQLRGMDYL